MSETMVPTLSEQIKSLMNRLLVAHRYGHQDDLAQVLEEIRELHVALKSYVPPTQATGER